jgi:hypothetical protein
MKKILAGLLLLSSISFAQTRDRDRSNQPPADIRHSFDRDHASPANANWTRSSSNWHASFRDNNNRSVDSYYDRRGNRIATHREIGRNDIPREVDMRIRNQYHGDGNNYNVRRIERPNAQPLFQVSLQLGGGNRTVYMDAQGRSRQYHSPY